MFKTIITQRRQWRLFSLAFMLTVGAAGGVLAKPAEPIATPNGTLLVGTTTTSLTPDASTPPAPGSLPELNLRITNDSALTPANPYGLRAIWSQGDFIARTTVLLLGIMSLLSWTLIIKKLREERLLTVQTKRARDVFSGVESMHIKTNSLSEISPFRKLTDSALDAARRYYSLSSQVDMSTWLSQDISRSIGALQMKTQDGLSVLATIGSTAPFVGLFGTVWGIYNALVTIGVSGQASIDKVAGPVGESLIMTALGLAVAVPAILGYNWLIRRNRVSMHGVKWFGSELHTLLLIEVEKSHRARDVEQKPE